AAVRRLRERCLLGLLAGRVGTTAAFRRRRFRCHDRDAQYLLGPGIRSPWDSASTRPRAPDLWNWLRYVVRLGGRLCPVFCSLTHHARAFSAQSLGLWTCC